MSYLNQQDTTRPYEGFDKAIAVLQSEIKEAVPYLSKVYHRAYLFREKDLKGKTIKVPKVWEDKREYINVLPNDVHPAMLFFYPTGDENVKDFDNEDSRNNLYDRDVCLILWLNTEKLEEHLTGPSLSSVKTDLLEALSLSDVVIRVNKIKDNDAAEIYQEFTINDESTQYLMLPYAGLRIDFTIKFNYSSC